MRRFLEWSNSTAGQSSSQQQQNYNKSSTQATKSRQHLVDKDYLATPTSQQSTTTTSSSSSTSLLISNNVTDQDVQFLTKLLHEIKYYQASTSPLPSAANSQNNRDFINKVHKTLPIFLNVFANDSTPNRTGQQHKSNQHVGDLLDVDSLLDESIISSKPNSPQPPSRSLHLDTIPDLLPFSYTIARLFVSEVRQKASNKRAEDASLAIINFLSSSSSPPNADQTTSASENQSIVTNDSTSRCSSSSSSTTKHEENSEGWNLLATLKTLSLSQNNQIIRLLCDASLPSTLVKCLYLFIDLPSDLTYQTFDTTNITQITSESGSNNDNSDASLRSAPEATCQSDRVEENSLVDLSVLIKSFSQLLVQLCSHQAAIDELIKKDDLRLLIGLATNQCQKHNQAWRRIAFKTMISISKSMRDNFIYLSENSCIQNYVESMYRNNSLSLINNHELIEMIATLLQFSYNLDVNNRNQPKLIAPLIEQIKNSRLMDLIEELVFKLDYTLQSLLTQEAEIITSDETIDVAERATSTDDSNDRLTFKIEEQKKFCCSVMQSLTLIAKINFEPDSVCEIMTLAPLAMSRYEMFEQFKMPKPSARNCILNLDTLRLMKTLWSKCNCNYFIETILDATISLFNDDKYNYYIFESQQLLVYYMTSQNFSSLTQKLKQKLFKFLEFIIIETNYIPCLELGTLGTLIKEKSCTESEIILVMKTFIACLRFNSKFSDIFREIGLLEIIVDRSIKTIQAIESTLLDSNNTASKRSLANELSLDVLYHSLETSQYLLSGPNNLNCVQFNESGAARYVFNCLSKPEFFHLFIPLTGSSTDSTGCQDHQSTSDQSSGSQRTHTPPLSALAKGASSLHSSNAIAKGQLISSRPPIKHLQKVAFNIIRQLIMSTAGDEHLANLLGLLARNIEDLKDLDALKGCLGINDPNNREIHVENSELRGDEDFSNLKSSQYDLNFFISQEINLKICVLKSLMIILKDSHRCRTLFRKAGGFIYIITALEILEKSLPLFEAPSDERGSKMAQTWSKINTRRIWRLIKSSLLTVVVAMRFEPANIRCFSDEALSRFTETIRKLGSFNSKEISLKPAKDSSTSIEDLNEANNPTDHHRYKSLFISPSSRDFSTIQNDSVQPDDACCQLLRYLYDMSMDMVDGTVELEGELQNPNGIAVTGHHEQIMINSSTTTKSMSFDCRGTQGPLNKTIHDSDIFKRRSQLNAAPKRPPSLDLNSSSASRSSATTRAHLSFPSVVLCILDLIPSCPNKKLMMFTSHVVKSLFKHERNQQLLCEAGMISKLLSPNLQVAITDRTHFLHQIFEWMFKKLARQSISSNELKTYLRIGSPMRCKSLDDIEISEETDANDPEDLPNKPENEEDKINPDRIETIAIMMGDTNGDLCERLNNGVKPPFVEFDLNHIDGIAMIFMPSIAPVNVRTIPTSSTFINSTLDVHTGEKNGILGGLGHVERQFPPQNGLTYSSWICIEKFPARSSDPTHNIRLLNLYRGSASTGREYSCLRIYVSALDRSLCISTQEAGLFDNQACESLTSANTVSNNTTTANSNFLDPESNLRIWTPDLLVESKWHHLSVVLQRSSVKQSNISVYIDGFLVQSQKFAYISFLVGSSPASLMSAPLGYSSGLNKSPSTPTTAGGHPTPTHQAGSSNSGGSAGSGTAYVNAFAGSLPQFRYQAQTRWKQGPCHLIEEPLSSQFVASIYAMGPNYIGNFQNHTKLAEISRNKLVQQSRNYLNSIKLHHSNNNNQGNKSMTTKQHSMIYPGHETHGLTRNASTGHSQQHHHHSSSSSSSLNALNEDKIILGLDARATSLMTLARMRRIYTRFDCRQVSRVLGLSNQESSTPLLLLHNTGLHLTGPSRGVGALAIGYNQVRCFVPNPIEETLFTLGGAYVLLAFVAQAETKKSLELSMKCLYNGLKQSAEIQSQMDQINGYQTLSMFFWNKKDLITEETLKYVFKIVTNAKSHRHLDSELQQQHKVLIHQVGALRELICESFDFWMQIGHLGLVLEFLYELISLNRSGESNTDVSEASKHQVTSTNNYLSTARAKNLKCLRELDLFPRILRLLPHYTNSDDQDVNSYSDIKSSPMSSSSFDAKAIYLIKQTVFELLNRTPRQSDILYFGQFLASLLPYQNDKSTANCVSLRNTLLKSLLQMLTKNNQLEVNQAMQEEIVRILGFDWFMLFINDMPDQRLDQETICLGFLNLMVLLTNEVLYSKFISQSSGSTSGTSSSNNANGSWLKEPTFTTMDGKFNIQLLGMNVSVFFGLSAKHKSIKHRVLETPNLYLFTHCVQSLAEIPTTYFMMFLLMISKFERMDTANILDTIGSFDKLTMESLCDSLVGETHHKRVQSLANCQMRCHELVVCMMYMLKRLICKHGDRRGKQNAAATTVQAEDPTSGYPTDIIKFIMYLYNNNTDFKQFCLNSDLLSDALCESIMLDKKSTKSDDGQRQMAQHTASGNILEFSRTIILDSICTSDQEINTKHHQLDSFERFLNCLSSCPDASGELIDMLMRQILLVIDSTCRQNTSSTIGSSDSSQLQHFKSLLINSISISRLVADKIWQSQIYKHNLKQICTIIDHQLCLTEQTFKFNELLPKQNAFIVQRVLNRLILFALSRYFADPNSLDAESPSTTSICDKMVLVDVLKRILDNRNIVILNHMHSSQSSEFFVCLTYLLMRLIEDNSTSSTQSPTRAEPSLIERSYGHPQVGPESYSSPSSASLMLASLAKKLWDCVYQSKKSLLSDTFGVSLSLPAFSLETSPDLMQLKPEICEVCQRIWSYYVEQEHHQSPSGSRARPSSAGNVPSIASGTQGVTSSGGQDNGLNAAQQNQSSTPHQQPISTVNSILSGRLTKVVNAASFVSRVVGATAGSMATNVNLVGERLVSSGQSKSSNRAESSAQSGFDTHGAGIGGGDQYSHNKLISAANFRAQRDTITSKLINEAFKCHISIIDDYIASQLTQKNHKLALHKYVCDEWLISENECLLRERALFGPERNSRLDKHSQDMTEGPKRMRKKMYNNTRQFYENYPYKHDQDYNPDANKSLRYRPPMSYDSRDYYVKSGSMPSHFLQVSKGDNGSSKPCATVNETSSDSIMSNQNGDDIESKDTNQGVQSSPTSNNPSPSLDDDNSSQLSSSKLMEPNDDCASFVDFSRELEHESNMARDSSENLDCLSVLRLLERNERISHMFRCSRVQGLDTYEGLLLFGREHFYLIDGFTLLKTREIKDIDRLPPDAHDPIIPSSAGNTVARSGKSCSKFSFESLVEVHKRRYLLQPIALELFSCDGRNTLLVFPRNIRNKVHSRLTSCASQLNSIGAAESLAGQKPTTSLEPGSGLLSSLMGDTSVTQRWLRGELSNFQYLMNLNTIAGRSYNDLMQYPVFPWVLADYSSHELDLTRPSSFRDLSRPVGAQTSERLAQFRRRYQDWDDATETPPYHYGTFYSSAMIVAAYLVRMEPFTQHFLRLQGGHFDLADRMFHSIQDSWLSASRHNMADVKELVPEFFYLPEYLTNSNRFDLGIRQDGRRLNDVKLPPWAKGDPREFIRLHRCALESPYVSANLHLWIDLIFGHKQQGRAAVEATNVFHHLFYEGNADIYNTELDPIKRQAVVGFINNFGQVPRQLFKRPHPARKIQQQTPQQLQYSGTSPSHIQHSSPQPVVITKCPQSLRPVVSTSAYQASASPIQSSGNSNSAGGGSHSNVSNVSVHSSGALVIKDLRGPVGQIVQLDRNNIVAVEQNKLLIGPEYARYVAWGHADRSLRLGLYDSERPVFVWEGSDHMAPADVLCATAPNSRCIVTGSTSSLITVWTTLDRLSSFAPIRHLYGHTEPVTCLASSQSYSLIVSGSRDKTAIVWDLNKLSFLRQLGQPSTSGDCTEAHRGTISAVAINDSTGDIATCASSCLYLWAINGDLLAYVDALNVIMSQPSCTGGALNSTVSSIAGQLHLLSVCFSQYQEWSLDEVIVTGNSDGSVCIWSMRYVQSQMTRAEIEQQKRDLMNEIVSHEDEDDDQDSDNNQNNDGNSTATEIDDQTETEKHEGSDQSTKTRISSSQRRRSRILNDESIEDEVCIDEPEATSGSIAIPQPSDPIGIVRQPRKRTDTINSDWVRLSASSTSTNYGELAANAMASVISTPPIDLELADGNRATPTAIPEPDINGTKSHLLTLDQRLTSSGDSSECPLLKSPNSKTELFPAVSQHQLDTSILDIKFSKSDTSLVDSFVMLGETPGKNSVGGLSMVGARQQQSSASRRPRSSAGSTDYNKEKYTQSGCQLLPNHKWRRDLYLRSLVPRQFPRQPPPAAVTCVTISKDCKTLFIGDANGKVTSWSV